jgi:hypothetical protein
VTVATLLADLRTRDIHVWAEDDHLKVNTLAGMLTPELQQQLQQQKSKIMEFLQAPVDLSFSQRRLWFLDQIEMVNTTYLVPWATRIEGPLQLDALEKALTALVARHESLRTTFPNCRCQASTKSRPGDTTVIAHGGYKRRPGAA